MKDKICWVRQEDVPKVWIHKGYLTKIFIIVLSKLVWATIG